MYDTISTAGTSVTEVKKSRFIGDIRHISSVSEAEGFLNSVRKKYFDAKHHCSAYIIRGTDGAMDIIHSSDDGEPSGTAGKPMLEVLEKSGLKDVMIVVTRYFGGTLLGTGGLARAYTEACKEALNNATVSTMDLMQHFSVTFDYTYTGVLDHYIKNHGINRLDAIYTDKTEYILSVRAISYSSAISDITEMTASTAIIVPKELIFSAV